MSSCAKVTINDTFEAAGKYIVCFAEVRAMFWPLSFAGPAPFSHGIHEKRKHNKNISSPC